MTDSPHPPRSIVASPIARALVLSTMLAALGAPAAQAAWTAPTTLTRPPLHDAFALHAAGNVKGVEAFAWVHTTHRMRRDPNGRGGYLRYVRVRTRLAHGALTSIHTVSRKDVIVDAPLVGVDVRGTTTVVWQESRRGRKLPFLMVAVAKKGKSFSRPVTLGRTLEPGELPVNPALAVASSGAAVIAWTQGDRMVAVRRRGGTCPSHSPRRCFGSVRRLSFGDRPVGSPAATIDADDNAYVAFATEKPAVRLVGPLGRYRFARPQRVSPVGQPASQPTVAAAGAEVDVVVAWRQAPEDSPAEGRSGPIAAATRSPTGVISPPQTVDGTAAGFRPAVRMTTQGEAILVWNRSAGDAAQLLASARPIGGSFGAPVIVAPSAASGQLVVDNDGNAVVGYVTPGGFAARLRPADGSFGAPMTLTGAATRVFISAGRRFTAAWVDDPAVKFSDLTF